MRLKDKVSLITGAGSGIGRATTLLFAEEGAKVVAIDRNREALEKTQFLIIFSTALSNIIDTLRINIAGAWNFVVIAELVAANSGLGNMIMVAQRFLKTDKIFVDIIAIGLIGLGIDFIFKLIFHLLVPWAVNKV